MTIQATSTMAATDWPCTRQISSSHPPRAAAAPGVALELFVFVLLLDLGWRHRLRERQRQGVAVVRARLAALLSLHRPAQPPVGGIRLKVFQMATWVRRPTAHLRVGRSRAQSFGDAGDQAPTTVTNDTWPDV